MPEWTDEQKAMIAKQEKELRYGCGCLTILLGIPLLIFACPNLWWVFIVASVAKDLAGDEIHTEVASPDGAYVAAVVLRSSGIIAPGRGGDERVLLRKANEKFTVDSERHINVKPVYEDPFCYAVEVKWKDKRTLVVTNDCYGGHTRPEEKETTWNDVKVKYKECEYGTEPLPTTDGDMGDHSKNQHTVEVQK